MATIAATAVGLERIEEKRRISGKTVEEIGRSTGEFGVSRSTAGKFLLGKPISVENFRELCKVLGLDWEEIAGLKETIAPSSQPELMEWGELGALVERMRRQGHPDIEKRCGRMRVLDMTTPIELGAIYTDINILEKIAGKTRRTLEELRQGCTAETFDRFSLGRVQEKRVDGLDAVRDKKQLMIFGKPGAGKTTFLKQLATLCNQGKFLSGQVPIFVTLKEFSETDDRSGLLNFVAPSFAPDISMEAVDRMLSQGRGLVLLDGLDEVLEKHQDRVLREVKAFAERYAESHIIITCRIAAREYIFQQFTEVETADFSDEQIQDFADKWFKAKEPDPVDAGGHSTIGQLFWQALETREPIKELAANPLLLTLLCLEFEESSNFPQSRAELYERGLNILLSRWDEQRQITRDEVYRRLSIKRKESLLGQLAIQTFEQGDYFFKEHRVEQLIGQYIQNLPDASLDPEALLVDSGAVLKSIEAQHGLLIERATGIYSFSHLTFHEYFTAKDIVDSTTPVAALEQLVNHLTEKRWREVFLLVAERMPSADKLLTLMKRQIDSMLAGDDRLQEFLVWVNQKSNSLNVSYKPAAVRVFYLYLDLRPYQADLDTHFAFNLNLNRAPALDRDLALTLDFALYFALEQALILDRDCDQGLYLILDFNCAQALDLILDRDLARDRDLALALSPELERSLQNLQDQLPEISEENRATFKQWWITNGTTWTGQLRAATIQHRNIGHDWQFSREQQELLLQYYDANKLLVDCLNSECCVSRAVREEIEGTLLLPVNRGHGG
jgi:predicted NACHT family NTPase/transcriptional regulator with XRE-family HTH domain